MAKPAGSVLIETEGSVPLVYCNRACWAKTHRHAEYRPKVVRVTWPRIDATSPRTLLKRAAYNRLRCEKCGAQQAARIAAQQVRAQQQPAAQEGGDGQA